MTLLRSFGNSAKAANKESMSQVAQKELLKDTRDPNIRKGICGGLVLAFLALDAVPAKAADVKLAGIRDAMVYNWKALVAYAARLQKSLMDDKGIGR